MATSKEYRLGDFTFPRGWFMIADAEELNTHKPLAVRFFGKDFALYRGRATGKVVLLDAYCPHMKTHLAAPNNTSYVVIDGGGSNVEGDGIRCPYHAWRFGAGRQVRRHPLPPGRDPGHRMRQVMDRGREHGRDLGMARSRRRRAGVGNIRRCRSGTTRRGCTGNSTTLAC